MSTRESCLIVPSYFCWNQKALVPVRDQGQCTSCWAFSVADMLSDRLSIYTNMHFKRQLSVQYMLSCFNNHLGCTVGGSPEDVYGWIVQNGLPLETEYPYEQYDQNAISKCKKVDDPIIRVSCIRSSIRDLCQPHFKVGDARHQANIRRMKSEIFWNGPIVGTVDVFQDFYDYQAGSVYTWGGKNQKYYGGHSCEIIGWKSDEYWIIRTNWGKDWPTKNGNGIVHVQMGTNEVKIDSRASCPVPTIPETLRGHVPDIIPKELYELKM